MQTTLNKSDKEETFEKLMLDTGRFPNIASGFVIIMYIFYFSGIPLKELSFIDFLIFSAVTTFLIFFFQFFIAPKTNHLIVKDISNELDQMKDKLKIDDEAVEEDLDPINISKRTVLLEKLLKLPIYISTQVCLVFVLAFGLMLFLLVSYFKLEKQGIIFSIAGFTFGNYFTGILSYSYAEELCHKYTEKLVKLSINESRVHEKKFFGISLKKRILLFITIPLIGSYILDFLFMKFNFIQDQTLSLFIFNSIFLILLNTAICILFAFFVYHQVTNTNHKINKNLESFLVGNTKENFQLPVNLGTEMSYNVFLVNKIIHEMQKTISKSGRISLNIDEETKDLSSMAEKMVNTAENLSDITDKSNEDMQTNVKRQINIISKHTNEVSHIANVMKNNVNEGFEILNDDIRKYEEINIANIETISLIKNLSEMIENVWESIKKINTLADKTKTIAFNAELEATQAGRNGENFHIVANEIRRLADSIFDSTSDIKDKIKSIQDASDNLIVTSEAGTQKIRDGSIFFSTLEEKFKELKLKSEITAEYANDIQSIISSQDAAFVQISTTLTQINIGFLEFAESTKTLTNSSENLKNVVFNLQNISKNKISEINDLIISKEEDN